MKLINSVTKFNLVLLIWIFSGFCSLYFRYDGEILFLTYLRIIPSAIILTILYTLITFLDQRIFGKASKTSFEELFSIFRRYFLSGMLYFILLLVYPSFIIPKSFPILTSILAVGLHLVSRKLLLYFQQRIKLKSNVVPVALYGAGSQAISIIQKILDDRDLDWKPIVILDDDINLKINSINGIVVVKGLSVENLIHSFKPKILIVTFTRIENLRLEQLQNICDVNSIELRIVSPSLTVTGKDFRVSDIRKPTQEELIGKSSIKIELQKVRTLIENKAVMITGAGGSIGSEIARQVSSYNPKKLFLLDRDESGLLETQLNLVSGSQSSSLILVDIRDQKALSKIMYQAKPEIVFHAAALKHLNILEKFPDEAIKTNVFGTNFILKESIKIGVQTFINISTDKAADPISVLGKTKLISERLTAFYSKNTNNLNSKYVSVRFGNVFGSRGSVIQTFQRQLEAGSSLTITHPRVSRYFMTMEEAVHLVLRAIIEGESGDTLILKMGEPVLIKDIAEKLIKYSGKDTAIKYSELQPGEKLNESLVGEKESQLRTSIEEIIRVRVEPMLPDELPIDSSELK
jgi:dTDP-glucose 4,6-dehydratase